MPARHMPPSKHPYQSHVSHWPSTLRGWEQSGHSPSGPLPREEDVVHRSALGALDALQTELDISARARQYEEARGIQRHIQDEKQTMRGRTLQELLQRHKCAVEHLESEFRAQYDLYVAMCNHQLEQVKGAATQQVEALATTHTAARADQQLAQETKTSSPKWSCQLLVLKQMEQKLARQRDFDKAAMVKKTGSAVEAHEKREQQRDRETRHQVERRHLAAQQQRQAAVLRQRMGAQRAEALERQQAQLQQLIRRYQAASLALERAHAAERLHFEQALLRAGLGISLSRKQPDLHDATGTSLADGQLLGFVHC